MQTKQKAKLIYATPLWLISNGIRYSHNNHNKSDTKEVEICPFCKSEKIKIKNGYYEFEPCYYCEDCRCIWECKYTEKKIGPKDFDIIKRVGFKLKHESVLEHSLIVYHIECSRAMLQELARHRHISLTVKSTRYTLSEIVKHYNDGNENFSDFFIRTNDVVINSFINKQILRLADYMQVHNISNDIAKYALPEAFKTELQLSLNFRELLHILRLRTNKDALWEFRQVAYMMFNELPDDYQELVLSDEQIKKQIEQCKEDFNYIKKGVNNENN